MGYYFRLSPRPPFRLDLTVWALRRQAHNRMDGWESETYRRVWRYGDDWLKVRLWQTKGDPDPFLEGEIYEGPQDERTVSWVRAQLTWMLSLDRDLGPFYVVAAGDPRLASLEARYRGLRPPRFPSLFEGMVNAVACQQLSLHLGITLLNRLSELCREGVGEMDQVYPFPDPGSLLRQEVTALRGLGFSGQKVTALRALAEEAAVGGLEREDWQHLPNAAAVQRLLRLRGIGRWSAEYVLLRTLGRLDVFPGDDVGARKALARWLEENGSLDYAQVAHRLRPWQPYAGMVYFLLLMRRLEGEGRMWNPGDELPLSQSDQADRR
ncbi:DNA-3-methyladenine glycosylase family protein [Acidithiobacillus ferrooxidans]|jgi:DNA-3-methyladenine glycosylase II|uniref:DNA-3-methyladenine glycosylase II n=4 Tax=Acidithiobacillus TaxID=119977 RepID=B7JBV2_ACIF2|nr:DNA-3-methyladenine glycosylase [Acidithiobacillus ferrooxidans]MCL5957418.1 DNA-3-methyladenine glycosylase [Gammaproteobacteria bacterium]ACH83750.1 HhH-GPD family protein [Acidithiobacillus ferrooxidans ATCC 53993]ACK79408.1 base excision repair protein, HhH-GPD family [Acidithiobacillus ferrooxidans ATCC 23270]MBU2772710.1 DNA-3-methyladenine glycosylase 2 family protein [Acidithiobacillus ferrooxidans]MBU2824132.1 DNA-3-methyladenine glycosylase 2 family protein [Acidithiobacillus ferr